MSPDPKEFLYGLGAAVWIAHEFPEWWMAAVQQIGGPTPETTAEMREQLIERFPMELVV